MRLLLTHILAVFTALTQQVSSTDASGNVELNSSDEKLAGDGIVFNFNFSLILLPEEVKREVPPPSFMKSWEETEYAMFSESGEQFEYVLNMSYLEIAKLHLLNANSGKLKGNDYAAHQASFKGNLTELTLDDVAYLYYNDADELVLDRSIPFYTNDETFTPMAKPTPTFEALI